MNHNQFNYKNSIPNLISRKKLHVTKNSDYIKKSNNQACIAKQIEHLSLDTFTSEELAKSKKKVTGEIQDKKKSNKRTRSLSRGCRSSSNSYLDSQIRTNSYKLHNLQYQCSSLRSSASSIFSMEDNPRNNEVKRIDYPNKRNDKFNNHTIMNFSSNFIKNLILKNDDLLVKTLSKNIDGFKNMFCSHRAVKEMNFVFQLLNRINELSDTVTKEHLLCFSFNEEFIENISNYISCLLLESSNENSLKNLQELIKFYSEIDIIPSEKLEDICELLQNSLSKLEKIKDIPVVVTSNIQDIIVKISEKINCANIRFDVASFHILPSFEDLSQNPTLTPNIINGSYESPAEYLKVHFKLYKEDFVSGLRSGLQEYEANLKDNNVKRFKDIFIYHAIYCGLIRNKRKNDFSLGFEIDNKKLKKVDWSTSKRLMHKSLLLISNDNFKTFHFAFLENNGNPNNSDNKFTISASVVDKLIRFQKYSHCVIIEPKVFFNPYFHVLNTFKKIDPNCFPMEKYIIHVNTETKYPTYISKESSYTINGNEINICDANLLKIDPEKFGLNKSQIVALQAALTKEFVIIQGPPGTGKSFLGLRIINILLQNKSEWNIEESPILVICYRNNAVDQILLSLINNGRNVVRLGSQSTNEVVRNCCLRTAVKDIHTHPIIRDKIKIKKNQIDLLKSKISQLLMLKTFIHEKMGILNISTFTEILSPEQKQFFVGSNVYEEWLLSGHHKNDNLLSTNELFENFIFDEHTTRDTELKEIQRYVLVNLYDLKNEIFYLNESIDERYPFIGGQLLPHDVLSCIVELLQHLEKKELFLKKLLNRINLESEGFIDPSCFNISDLSELSVSQRWQLYHYWADEFSKECDKKIEEFFIDINEAIRALEDLYDKSDGDKLCKLKPDVVGATTSGAARLHSLLAEIKPKIVVFEEAAEILEAHTIAALTQFCEHVIMIGDHQQLRPNPASHMSVIQYKLDISLFERMILNKMEYFPLNEQHRMRPLISSLVIPQFYPTLSNHSSVENYPDVKGLRDNMFFLDHTIPEDEMIDSDSQRNKYEASFILALADYLLKQGYQQKYITILTFYGAQLIYLKAWSQLSFAKSFFIRECFQGLKIMLSLKALTEDKEDATTKDSLHLKLSSKYPSLKNVSIEVVDNFQGEENQIILLSLVRSNPNSIGFLSKMNRICVALTRAREGFYLVGNMTTLKGNSSVWKGINETLKKNRLLGDQLPLKCSTHGTLTFVQSYEDFVPLTYGGCTLKCGLRLDCGHVCEMQCHSIDESHLEAFSCTKPCERKKNCEIHDCDAVCGVPCPKCNVTFETELPCGHLGLKICAGDFLPCKSRCSEPLPCGHPCSKDCHHPVAHLNEVCQYPCGLPNKNCPTGHKCEKPCGVECGECQVKTFINLQCGHIAHGKCNAVKKTDCEVLVKKELECGHTIKVRCSKPINEVKCKKLKQQLLDCGHTIKVPCSGCAADLYCSESVNKDLPCGHTKIVPCYLSEKEDIFCDTLVQKELNCEHKFKLEKCSTPLTALVCEEKVVKTVECGHKIEVMCHLASGPNLCDKPCDIKRPCGHNCSGLCGMPCPSQCTELVKIQQVCGHEGFISCSKSKEDLSEAGYPEIEGTLGIPDCQTICNSKLKCGHPCEGTCGTCMQGRVHEPCLATCGQLLLCGHKCTSGCNAGIHLCNQKCSNNCKHQTCKNLCSDFCRKCKNPCEWRCEHFKCTRLCWEDCDRSPCDAACKKLLECGHACRGLCGEPCPPICPSCSPDKYSDTRYILLEDCGHCISQNEISILIKSCIGLFLCPICQKPPTKTNYIRYYSKNWFMLLPKIRNVVSKKYNNINGLRNDLKSSLGRINKLLKIKLNGCNELKLLLEEIVKQTKVTLLTRNQLINIESLRSLNFISYYICEAFTQLEESNCSDDINMLLRINHLALYLRKQVNNTSRAQMYQFKDELCRLSFFCGLTKIKNRTSIKFDDEKKQCFDRAWESACVMKEFETAKKDVASCMSLLDPHFQIDTNHSQSEFLSIFEKYYPLMLHKQNWVKCKKYGHVIFCVENIVHPDCPTCLDSKQQFFYNHI